MYVAGRGLALPATPWTPYQLANAAALTWPDCTVSHRTAAAVHGFRLGAAAGSSVAEVITGRGRRSGRGLRVHSLQLSDLDVCTVASRVRLTRPPRTALDCLAALPLEQALDLWAWVSTRSVLDVGALDRGIVERRCWDGTLQLAVIARLVRHGAVSGGEYRLHQLLRRAGFGGWRAGVQLFDRDGLIGVADVLFTAARVVVEIDGFRAHSSQEAFVRDRRRQNRMIMARYVVLRFTWDDLVSRPAAVLRQIRAALDSHGL